MNDCKTHMWRILVPPSLTSPFVTSVTTATRMKLSPPSSKLLDLYYIEDYYRLVQIGTGTKIWWRKGWQNELESWQPPFGSKFNAFDLDQPVLR